ncbi:MAG: HAMP domain-containing sensor histidine kinase [Peptostreptococcaceae bacterium]|nr:HAMP domain-containing sensor histidine kinase [Peptostreptococcaceae bacterium]
MILSAWITFLICKYKNQKRINEMLSLISRLERRDYTFPMKQDDFSVLEDEIYKLFLKTVEQHELTKKFATEQGKNLEDIAHQIKTPITSILFELETMPPDDSILHIRRQIVRLSELVHILLKLSSLEVNQENMKSESVLLPEIVEYALDVLSGDIEAQHVLIQNKVENHVINGDFYWLSEAFINILKNAVQISERKTIYLYSKENPLYIDLVIEDEAGGIPKELMKNIFKRFYKTPDSNGFGIGLAISKLIVEKNNGMLIAMNKNQGACFVMRFYKK